MAFSATIDNERGVIATAVTPNDPQFCACSTCLLGSARNGFMDCTKQPPITIVLKQIDPMQVSETLRDHTWFQAYRNQKNRILGMLVRNVERGGNFLLNVATLGCRSST
jgi:hypothetical protein